MSGLSPVAARLARAQARAQQALPAPGLQFELFGGSAAGGEPASMPARLHARVRSHPSDPARVRVFGTFAQVCAALEALCAAGPHTGAAATH